MEIMCLVKDRKQLVTAIEKYSGEKMKYMGPPTFAYTSEGATVLRDGTLVVESLEENKAMLLKLADQVLLLCLFECDTWFPETFPLPHTLHTFAIYVHLLKMITIFKD